MSKLDGKVIVVTGASGTLGRALAERFAAEAARAIVLGDLDAETLDGCVDNVERAGTRAEAVVTDVRDPDAVERLVARAVDRFGRLDVMVNNAGVLSPNRRIHNLTVDDWRASIDVNLVGTFNGIKAAVSVMRAQDGGGSIVSTASIAGKTGWAYAAPYGATKAAVINLTKVAALEYARDQIRVNCVCPGSFPSGIFPPDVAGALATIADRHPLGLGDADAICGAFVYLASDDARWTTGTALVVDGGYSAP